ncbi:MAG: hypothetical protein Q9M08_01680 [Mariprofundus sp.]|nr:hypothetical protein [Mariprofundus sp.]
MKYLSTFLVILFVLAGCQVNGAGLVIAPGWIYHSLGAWKQLMPNQIVLSSDGRWLYFGSEVSEFSPLASVAALHTESGRTHLLVQGLRNVNGLRIAPDASLWIAEGSDQGGIWRMVQPDHFPDDQRVNPVTRESTHPGIAPFRFAGRFAHRAIAFSADQHFAYLADATTGGSLYRLDIRARQLSVLHREKGWLNVVPEDAVKMGHTFGAASFASIADIERMQDGSFLLAESGSGKILRFDDQGDKPQLETWLQREELRHPVDLAWDEARQWLWIADEAVPSTLWAWDGHNLYNMVRHLSSRISAVLAAGDNIYVNLQRGRNNPSMTFVLRERHQE